MKPSWGNRTGRSAEARRSALLALTVTCGAVGACDLLGPEEQELIGILENGAEAPFVSYVPESVPMGHPFFVTFHTYPRCFQIAKVGRTTVRMSGMTAEVKGYDVYGGSQQCNLPGFTYTHEAELRFNQIGTGTIQFRGISMPDSVEVTFSREIEVTQPVLP